MPDLGEFHFLLGMNEVKAAMAHPQNVCSWASQASDPLSPSVQVNSAAHPLRTSPASPEPEGSDSGPPEILTMEKKQWRGNPSFTPL